MHIYSYRAAIAGITGYAGRELERLLAFHPRIEVSGRYSSKEPLTVEKLKQSAVDVVILATDAELSMQLAPELLDGGFRVIDMSGAFRLKDARLYPEWYGFSHSAPHLLDEAAYGIPEVHAGHIRNARLVSNPGCYATAAILPLLPLFTAGAIDPSSLIVIDGKSGASGAGRQPRQDVHFCEVNENISAYRVLRHRHTPEMVTHLPGASFDRFVFTPHLIPISRGILNTIVISTPDRLNARAILADTYASTPFIKIFPEGQMPDVQRVAHTNKCLIGIASEGRKTVIVSAIDNLVKGAAGQAIQNLNLMLGCDPAMGLVA
jgi:N-acetyl-gamma-glutamyl-phosphate reductase